MKLSIIMPCYNERKTIKTIIEKVLDQPYDIELIVVDDKSDDGTQDILHELSKKYQKIRVIFKSKNEGKGAALRQGFRIALGDFILIQDADFEYDPADYEKLLNPLLNNKADVVYGSRFLSAPHHVLRFWHWQYPANKIVTIFCNMVANIRLTDMETCYKVFRRKIIQSVVLNENRFGIEPEITIKIARIPNIRIYEVPISYHSRSRDDGKKIRFLDVIEAIFVIAKYGFLSK